MNPPTTPLEAVILAGGVGSRLQPFTAELPKPLVPIGGRPIVEILLTRMRKSGVSRVRLAVNHMAERIIEVLGDGSRFGMEILYSHEESPLSTVAPLKLMHDLPERFLVANGDILTDLDFRVLFDAHFASGCDVTVATHTRVNDVDYGVLDVGPNGRVTGFKEKPTYSLTVSMGIYAFSRSILDLVPEGQRFGFDDLMLAMIEHRRPINTYSYDGYWLDVGRPDDYAQAQRDIKRVESLL